jgi:hypothetical protein
MLTLMSYQRYLKWPSSSRTHKSSLREKETPKSFKIPSFIFIYLLNCLIRHHRSSLVSIIVALIFIFKYPHKRYYWKGLKSGERAGQETAASNQRPKPASRIIFGQQLLQFTTTIRCSTVVLKPYMKTSIEGYVFE